MQQMSSSDMIILCVGALLFGLLIGAIRPKGRSAKYGAGSALAGDKRASSRKVVLGIIIACLVLYAIAVVIVMVYGNKM